eukprot:NODE_4942_length_720_cov_22.241147_g4779_i0.p1 GENE.NODE_4942_length_720_cov_22.241147_g4779_i0~~NODE_4942_length_720_cov_22.241147_g4779_i0.p1  ORF type:complete len:115 (+),score=31.76 NODE_4942_length_720_cov_22.241147_g4779_i0:295-639(+)
MGVSSTGRSQWVSLSPEPLNMDHAVQWVNLVHRILRLAMENLSKNKQKYLINAFRDAWGISARRGVLAHTALRFAQILRPQYPSIFPSPSPPFSSPTQCFAESGNTLEEQLLDV